MVIADDNDIIIEFEKIPISHFFFEDTGAKYICNIIFKNNIGNVLTTISCTDTEMILFIDNIEVFLFDYINSNDISYYFSSTDSSMISKLVKLEKDNSKYTFVEYNGKMFYRYNVIFNVFHYRDEDLVKVLSFNMTNKLIEFLNQLYESFIIDNNGIYLNQNIEYLQSIQ